MPHRRRWVHWPSQLTALSRTAHEIPHAILQLGPFNGVDSDITAAAVSQLLQAVSGSGYPPSLSDCTKLAERIGGGKLVGGFTGGGCAVHPVVHSKGRYMLVVPQRDQAALMQILKTPQSSSNNSEDATVASPLPTPESRAPDPSSTAATLEEHDVFLQVSAG